MRSRTVLLAEAKSEYSHWLLSCLAESHVTVLGSVSDPTIALALGVEHAPDVALFGVEKMDCPMFAAGSALLRRAPRTRVLFYAPQPDRELVGELLLAGAAGVACRTWTRGMVGRIVASLLRGDADADDARSRVPRAPDLSGAVDPTLFLDSRSPV
ncbi:MAG TPA: hypothetical protein VGE52_18480 [Pirellulales bacterium]